VLQGALSVEGSQAAPPSDFAWAFVVAEADPGTTRLLVRKRYAYTQTNFKIAMKWVRSERG
jgi:hypothetical protein